MRSESAALLAERENRILCSQPCECVFVCRCRHRLKRLTRRVVKQHELYARKRRAYVAPSRTLQRIHYLLFLYSLIRLFSISTLAFAIKAGVCFEDGWPRPTLAIPALTPPIIAHRTSHSSPHISISLHILWHSRVQSQFAFVVWIRDERCDASCLFERTNERTHKVV